MKQSEKQNNKKYNLKMILLIILIVIILLSIFLVFKYLKKDGQSYYESKMIEYGLADEYNNGTPNEKDSVTKSEAVKMVLETMMNGRDISNYIDINTMDRYDNYIWVQYAISINLLDLTEITNANENEIISYIDVIKILNSLINKNYIPSDRLLKEVNEEDIKIKKISEYSEEEKNAIQALIQYGIIPNGFNYKKNKILTKKQFNELLVNFYEKCIYE